MRHAYIHTRALPIVRYNSALTIILLYSRGRATRSRRRCFRFSCRVVCAALPAVPAVIISRAISASHTYPPPVTHLVSIQDREYHTNTIHPLLQCATIYTVTKTLYYINCCLSVHTFSNSPTRTRYRAFLLVVANNITHTRGEHTHTRTPIVVFGASHTDHRQKHNGATLLFRVRLRRRRRR